MDFAWFLIALAIFQSKDANYCMRKTEISQKTFANKAGFPSIQSTRSSLPDKMVANIK